MEDWWRALLVFVTLTLALIKQSSAIWCFECTSSQPGCGKDLSWKLQKWHWCTSYQGQPAMCVKYKEVNGASERYVRGCVNSLFQNTFYRQEMPSVRRENYCVLSKSTGNRIVDEEETKTAERVFCFCNEMDGCNSAGGLTGKLWTVTLASFLSLLFVMWRH